MRRRDRHELCVLLTASMAVGGCYSGLGASDGSAVGDDTGATAASGASSADGDAGSSGDDGAELEEVES
ncbi:MAG: hypothetical protein IAG13_30875, partial [Deltaproteobacteria bacterium]|nr:hypothetical protein [Nannocystaceae bacterium]